jgi:hypothetical protein
MGGCCSTDMRCARVKRVASQANIGVIENVRIGEIRRQRQLIVTKARARQEELQTVDQQFETGQIARVMIE